MGHQKISPSSPVHLVVALTDVSGLSSLYVDGHFISTYDSVGGSESEVAFTTLGRNLAEMHNTELQTFLLDARQAREIYPTHIYSDIDWEKAKTICKDVLAIDPLAIASAVKIADEKHLTPEQVDELLNHDGVFIEDTITNMGVDCNYLGDSIWLINGEQHDSSDVRELLFRIMPEKSSKPHP